MKKVIIAVLSTVFALPILALGCSAVPLDCFNIARAWHEDGAYCTTAESEYYAYVAVRGHDGSYLDEDDAECEPVTTCDPFWDPFCETNPY